MRLKLSLPWPPSANTYYRMVTIKGRPVMLLSAAGRRYKRNVLARYREALEQRASRRLEGRLALAITLHPPDRRAIDVDNRIKAVQDALQYAGAFTDDSQIDVLLVMRGATGRERARADIVLEEITTGGLFRDEHFNVPLAPFAERNS